MKKIITISLIFCIAVSLKANYDFTDNCKNANYYLFRLEFQRAKEYLSLEKQKNPGNSYLYFLENYIDFFEVLFDGSKQRFEKYKPAAEARLNKIKADDKNSPYYLMLQSEIYLQNTMLYGMFSEFVNAGIDFYKSYTYTEDNIKKYPTFIFNKKDKALHELIMSVIPDEYKNLFAFIGFKGTAEKGLQYLDEFYEYAKKVKDFEIEAALFKYFALSQFEKDLNVAIQFLTSQKYQEGDNIILNLAYLYTLKEDNKTDEALNYFEQKKIDPAKVAFPHFYYIMGSIKLTRLDDDSNIYFEKFLNTYKGEHFVKHTYRKLAWYYFLHDNQQKYRECIQNIKKKGATTIEYDKQALYEMTDSTKLNKNLIRAKLLYDGGYFLKAKDELIKNADAFKKASLNDQVEFFMRLGLIYKELGQIDKAQKNFNYALQYGAKLPYCFAPLSALELGLIYEDQKNYKEAEQYYNKCIDINLRQYYLSIDRKARSGLKRVKGK